MSSSSATHAAPQVFTAGERRITLIGVLLVFLLSALDQTIISTAMPRIVGQLGGLNLYAWVSTAYMLASTVTVPIYGKLSDIYGRKAIITVGVLLFLLGSALCGLAGEFGTLPLLGDGMTQLILFRGLQGFGGGALITGTFAILADLYPPRERAKFSALLGSTFGVASILGPIIGGFLTDLGTTDFLGVQIEGWRYIFYINVPLGGIALFMILAKAPRMTHRSPGSIDFFGAALIGLTFVPLLLALGWGGRDQPWSSPLIVALLALSAVSLLTFLWVESRVANPIINLGLFRNRVFSIANAANFFSSMAFMGSLAFLPLYMQLGQGVAATTSGLTMLPLMAGMVVSSTINGRVLSKTGQYKPNMVLGAVVVVIGLWLISRVGVHTSSVDLMWRLAVAGVGLGANLGSFNIAVQNAVSRSQTGVATSATQFFRQIGGAVGVAVFGAILTHNLNTSGESGPDGHPFSLAEFQSNALHAPAATAAAHLSPALEQSREVLVSAVTSTFSVAAGIATLALLLILLVPALPLEQKAD